MRPADRFDEAVAPSSWGVSIGEVVEAIDNGGIDIEIGGCCTIDDSPTHRCAACGESFLVPKTAGERGGPTRRFRARQAGPDGQRGAVGVLRRRR